MCEFLIFGVPLVILLAIGLVLVFHVIPNYKTLERKRNEFVSYYTTDSDGFTVCLSRKQKKLQDELCKVEASGFFDDIREAYRIVKKTDDKMDLELWQKYCNTFSDINRLRAEYYSFVDNLPPKYSKITIYSPISTYLERLDDDFRNTQMYKTTFEQARNEIVDYFVNWLNAKEHMEELLTLDVNQFKPVISNCSRFNRNVRVDLPNGKHIIYYYKYKNASYEIN